MRLLTTTLVLASLFLDLGSCQMDCAFPSDDDIGSVISDIIAIGDSPSTPTIAVLDFQVLCLAYSEERNRSTFFSVLVHYTCVGNTNSPAGTAVEQIESECKNGKWSNTVFGSTINTRRTNPTAVLVTPTREDCSACLSTTLASVLGSSAPDPNTHCLGESVARCSVSLSPYCYYATLLQLVKDVVTKVRIDVHFLVAAMCTSITDVILNVRLIASTALISTSVCGKNCFLSNDR